MTALDPALGRFLRAGAVIPAHPLALTAEHKIDERHTPISRMMNLSPHIWRSG